MSSKTLKSKNTRRCEIFDSQSLNCSKIIEYLADCFSSGVPDRVEFSPREGWKEVAVNAELNLCAGSCNLTRVAVTAILTTGHIGKGCDRDTYSLQSQRKLCGNTFLVSFNILLHCSTDI